MSSDNKQTQRSKSREQTQRQRQQVNNFYDKNDSQLFQKSRKIINKIHQNQKRNSLTYRSYHPTSMQKKIRKTNSIQIHQSINELRQRSNSQRSKTSLIQNRLHYLKVSTSRQQKLTNIAKDKFLRVNQIRHKSFTQKNILAKQKGIVLYQHAKSIKQKVNRIKSEKCLSQISQKEISMRNKKQAQQVRKQRKINEYIIKSRRQEQEKRKKQNAQKVHKSLVISSQKLKNLSMNKVKNGMQNHKKQIIQEFQNVQIQKKINQKLMRKFKTQALAIFDQKTAKQKQLEQYEKYLGLSIGVKRIQKYRKVGATSKLNMSALSARPLQNSATSNISKVSSTYTKNSPSSSCAKKQEKGGFYLTNPQIQN